VEVNIDNRDRQNIDNREALLTGNSWVISKESSKKSIALFKESIKEYSAIYLNVIMKDNIIQSVTLATKRYTLLR